MSTQTPIGQTTGLRLNTRSLVVGGLIVAAGVTVAGFGASVIGAAVLAAARDWAQSEQSRELVAKARVASTAAADAWRGKSPREIVLPDARTPASVS